MNHPFVKNKATTAQLAYLHSLWKRAEFGTTQIGAMAQATLAKVGVLCKSSDDVDTIFGRLSNRLASELIKQMEHDGGKFRKRDEDPFPDSDFRPTLSEVARRRK
jgi:hypothetical protein